MNTTEVPPVSRRFAIDATDKEVEVLVVALRLGIIEDTPQSALYPLALQCWQSLTVALRAQHEGI